MARAINTAARHEFHLSEDTNKDGSLKDEATTFLFKIGSYDNVAAALAEIQNGTFLGPACKKLLMESLVGWKSFKNVNGDDIDFAKVKAADRLAMIGFKGLAEMLLYLVELNAAEEEEVGNSG